MDQKLEFAEQLQAPMHIAGLESRPAVLFNLFNTHKWGRSVTFQAVSRWLRDEYVEARRLRRPDEIRVRHEVYREALVTVAALNFLKSARTQRRKDAKPKGLSRS